MAQKMQSDLHSNLREPVLELQASFSDEIGQMQQRVATVVCAVHCAASSKMTTITVVFDFYCICAVLFRHGVDCVENGIFSQI